VTEREAAAAVDRRLPVSLFGWQLCSPLRPRWRPRGTGRIARRRRPSHRKPIAEDKHDVLATLGCERISGTFRL